MTIAICMFVLLLLAGGYQCNFGYAHLHNFKNMVRYNCSRCGAPLVAFVGPNEPTGEYCPRCGYPSKTASPTSQLENGENSDQKRADQS